MVVAARAVNLDNGSIHDLGDRLVWLNCENIEL
jgi:hypothetical protein